MRPFEILEPTSVAEASQALRRYGDAAKVVSGGTAVALLLKEGLLAPDVLISTQRLPHLEYVRNVHGALAVGARTTLRVLERSAEVRKTFPALARALAAIGNVRIRHAATVGGHLAHADARLDLPPVLIALGARVRCAKDGASREVPVADLFVGSYETCLAPDELITELIVPVPPADAGTAFARFNSTSPTDWPCLNVGVLLALAADGRIVRCDLGLGGVAARPLPMPGAHTGVLGERLTAGVLRALADRAAARTEPVTDLRGSADYKREMTKVFVRRALREAARALGHEVA